MKGTGLRAVLVGGGHWHAARHLESLIGLGHTIVGVSDPNPDAARRVGEQIGCRSSQDPVELIHHLKPDLIMAMGVHQEVPAIVDRLLDTQVPMILEKPLGRNACEARPLVEKAERKGLFVAVSFPIRYAWIWKRMLDLQAAGEFGEISYASFRLINGTPERYRLDGVAWMLDPKVAGGGSLLNLGIHAADAFLSVAGGPVKVLSAQISNKIHRLQIEDYSVAILRSSTGVLGVIESGYSYPAFSGGDMEWRLVSDGAYLQQGRETCTLRTMAGRHETERPPSMLDLYRRMTEDAIEQLRRGQPPPASLRNCLEAMELIDAIYAAAGGLPREPRPTRGSS